MIQDPYFPQMADALNPAIMGPLLSWVLDIPSAKPGQLAWYVGEKRHKPGKSLVISYRLANRTHLSAASCHVTGRLCPPGTASQEFEAQCRQRPDLAAGALRFLHEPAMLIWAFPYDRKLIHLPALLDSKSSTSRIGTPDLTGDYRVQSVESEVLHYLPERSCMIRYRISVANCDHPLRLYAKNYAGDSGGEVFDVMRQMNGQFAWGAKALAYDAQTRTLWQSHFPGTPLCWADLQTAGGLALAERIGRCVAAFHACAIDTPRRFGQSDIDDALAATVGLASPTQPELVKPIKRLVDDLLTQAPDLPKPALAALHHDLKLNNFLIDGDRLGLIDLDCVCLGDPLADLASLIANFYLHGLREGDAIKQVHPLVNRLVNSYLKHSAHAVPLSALRWQVAAALIHEVTRRSLRQMDALRIARIQNYLALSENYLALSRQPTGAGDALV